VNEIEQLDLQLNELLMKRKGLEQTWEDLDKRDTELQLISKVDVFF
jgi:chaperonin cofactor prefoldin